MFRNTLLWWKINVSRNVIPCKLVVGYQIFGETYRLALQGGRVGELYGLSYRKTILFLVTAVNNSNIVNVLFLIMTLRPCSCCPRRWPCRSKYVEGKVKHIYTLQLLCTSFANSTLFFDVCTLHLYSLLSRPTKPQHVYIYIYIYIYIYKQYFIHHKHSASSSGIFILLLC